MEISISGLKNGNPLDYLKLCYSLCPDKLAEAFAKVKIQVQDEKDLDVLSKIIDKKIDTQGMLRDPNDETMPLMFDSMRIINGIEFSQEEADKCKTINFID